MRESDFQTKLTRWAKHNLDHSCAIEAKITKTRRLPFSALQPHQLMALQASRRSALAFKIADLGLTPKPFDMFVLVKARAYIAVQFYTKGCKHFYLIPVEAWEQAETAATSRSLTEEDVSKISLKCHLR